MSDGKYNYDQVKDMLVGGTISEALIDDDEEGAYCGFVVKNGDKTFAVWISRDPEQNGPGWMDIGDVTEKLAEAGG